MRFAIPNPRCSRPSLALAPGILLSWVLLAQLLTAQAGVQPELRPRWMPTKESAPRITEAQDPRRIVFKLRDDAGAWAFQGRLLGTAGRMDVVRVAQLVNRIPAARVEPLIPLDGAVLADLRARGEGNLGQELADLSQYFLLELPTEEISLRVLAALLRLPEIENAYAAPRHIAPPGFFAPGDYTGSQNYRDAAPTGIDAAWAVSQALPGAGGANVKVVDIEWSWSLKGMFGYSASHLDFTTLEGQSPTPAIGSTTNWYDPGSDPSHGDAVVGILAADVDSVGISGLVPNATTRVLNCYIGQLWSVPAAITTALTKTNPGDVLLIEQQVGGPNFKVNNQSDPQFGSVAVEYYDAEFNAIKQATALCVHVVEAAGNGSQDYDDDNGGVAGTPGQSTGHPSYVQKFDPTIRISGAVLVGAASSAVPHARMSWSNHGKRVDCYAWGENVYTLGYGDLYGSSNLDNYTKSFGGTSSASAIATAAVTILESEYEAMVGGHLDPDALRMLLRTTGTQSSNPSSDRIGRQPDLMLQATVMSTGMQPSLVFSGEAAGSFAATSVAGAGDVNGDGFDDLVVGAPNYFQSGAQGRAYVISGVDGARIHTFSGGAQNLNFGHRVAGAGDVDNDGFADILVGDRWATAGGVNAGQAYVYSGRTGGLLYSYTGSSIGTGGDELGCAVDGVGDMNGDGYDDFAAGALGVNSGTGAAYVWSGFDGSLLYTFNGQGLGDLFGYALSRAGDVDGDGTPDVVIGAPLNQPLNNGAAYVFSGANGGQIRAWTSFNNYERFGDSVAGGGDLNNDGFDDVLIGAPDAGFSQTGAVYPYSGRDGSRLLPFAWLSGQGQADSYGRSVAIVGDVDADGCDDFLVGADGHDPVWPGKQDGGRAYLISGKSGNWIRTFDGEGASHRMGHWVSRAGDVNGDGQPDVLVGAHHWGPPVWSQDGRAYVFLTPKRCAWKFIKR